MYHKLYDLPLSSLNIPNIERLLRYGNASYSVSIKDDIVMAEQKSIKSDLRPVRRSFGIEEKSLLLIFVTEISKLRKLLVHFCSNKSTPSFFSFEQQFRFTLTRNDPCRYWKQSPVRLL